MPVATPVNQSDFAHSGVEAEYQRVLATLNASDDPELDGCLTIRDVLRAHFLIADFFYSEGAGMGGIGPRDMTLLHSAVYRQHVGYGGTRKWDDKFDIGATLLFGLVKDHPFHDANKRTAMLTALYHLSQCKRTPTVTHQEFEDFIVDIAEDRLSQFARYQELVARGDGDPEVRMIAYYLRTKTRVLDTRQYTITFWDLKRILNRFNFDLQNPRHNNIDVVKIEWRKPLFGKRRQETHFVAQIGFPSWTKQVGAAAVQTVRRTTGLTPQNHVDSQAFYFGIDDVRLLIAHYQDPLRRLANR